MLSSLSLFTIVEPRDGKLLLDEPTFFGKELLRAFILSAAALETFSALMTLDAICLSNLLDDLLINSVISELVLSLFLKAKSSVS